MPRPREFNEADVLDAATDAFWAHGYEATSTRDLVRETGLTQPSLYNAFGDKRALFRRVLEHYLERSLRERMAHLEAAHAPAEAIAAFFGETVERSLNDPLRRGCLLVNSALEARPEDADLSAAIAQEIGQIEAFFVRCLRAAQALGTLPAATPPETGAAHLLAVLLGVRVLARTRPERTLIATATASALRLLGLPPMPPMPPIVPADVDDGVAPSSPRDSPRHR